MTLSNSTTGQRTITASAMRPGGVTLGNWAPRKLERFGLAAFGAHSNDDEYILVDSIEPRLYLASRLIMDFSRGLAR